MCILKTNVEGTALKSKRSPASPSEEKCARLNQSNIHGQRGVEAALPYFSCVSEFKMFKCFNV